MFPFFCFCSFHPTFNIRKIMTDDRSDGQYGSVKLTHTSFLIELMFHSSHQLLQQQRLHACR